MGYQLFSDNGPFFPAAVFDKEGNKVDNERVEDWCEEGAACAGGMS